MRRLHKSHWTDTKTEIRKVVASSINERFSSPGIESKPPLTVEEVRAMSDQELDYALNYDEGKPLRINSLGILSDELFRRRALSRLQNRDFFERYKDAFGDFELMFTVYSVMAIPVAIAMWVKVFIPWLKNIF